MMNYVCRSLTWWQTGALVAELKLEQSSLEMDAFSLRATMGHPPDSLTVPIPMDAEFLRSNHPEAVFGQFMQKLTPLLTQLGTGLQRTERIYTALISLASSVRSSSSTRVYAVCYSILTTE